jgi:hypothetical protein
VTSSDSPSVTERARPETDIEKLRFLADWFDSRDALVIQEGVEQTVLVPNYIPSADFSEVQADLRRIAAELAERDRRDRYIPDDTLALARAAVEVADVLPDWDVWLEWVYTLEPVVDCIRARRGEHVIRVWEIPEDDRPEDGSTWWWSVDGADEPAERYADSAADAARAALSALGVDTPRGEQ